MHKDKFFRLCLILAILLVALACSVSFNDGDDETEALKAQLTQQSMQITQTIAPAGHNKPVPIPDSDNQQDASDGSSNSSSSDGDGVYALKFLSEDTPGGTNYLPGDSFTKSWTIRNDGDFEWTKDFTIDFSSGERMGGAYSTKLGRAVAPGETIILTVTLTAPDNAGDYTGRWQVSTDKGVQIGLMSVKITVLAVLAPQPQAGPGFLEIVDASFPWAYDDVSLTCPDTVNVTANITTNGAGTLSCTWSNSSQADGDQITQSVTFAGAETQTLSYVVGPIGSSDVYQVDFYCEWEGMRWDYGLMPLFVNCN